MKQLKTFTTAFLQVFLISANTYFISRKAWTGVAVAGFGISYLWTVNVKKMAFSTVWDRVIYAGGAMLGGLAGLWIANLLVGVKL